MSTFAKLVENKSSLNLIRWVTTDLQYPHATITEFCGSTGSVKVTPHWSAMEVTNSVAISELSIGYNVFFIYKHGDKQYPHAVISAFVGECK